MAQPRCEEHAEQRKPRPCMCTSPSAPPHPHVCASMQSASDMISVVAALQQLQSRIKGQVVVNDGRCVTRNRPAPTHCVSAASPTRPDPATGQALHMASWV